VVTIVLGDGSPIPAGAVAQVQGQAQPAPVGMNGEAYLTGLDASSRVHVSWRGQDCDLLVLYTPGDAPVPQLGTYTCAGVQP
jgi:outer membrane usher protein